MAQSKTIITSFCDRGGVWSMSHFYVYVTGGRSEGAFPGKTIKRLVWPPWQLNQEPSPSCSWSFVLSLQLQLTATRCQCRSMCCCSCSLRKLPGYDCFTLCTAVCFAAGFPGDYCDVVCERECADEAQKH